MNFYKIVLKQYLNGRKFSRFFGILLPIVILALWVSYNLLNIEHWLERFSNYENYRLTLENSQNIVNKEFLLGFFDFIYPHFAYIFEFGAMQELLRFLLVMWLVFLVTKFALRKHIRTLLTQKQDVNYTILEILTVITLTLYHVYFAPVNLFNQSDMSLVETYTNTTFLKEYFLPYLLYFPYSLILYSVILWPIVLVTATAIQAYYVSIRSNFFIYARRLLKAIKSNCQDYDIVRDFERYVKFNTLDTISVAFWVSSSVVVFIFYENYMFTGTLAETGFSAAMYSGGIFLVYLLVAVSVLVYYMQCYSYVIRILMKKGMPREQFIKECDLFRFLINLVRALLFPIINLVALIYVVTPGIANKIIAWVSKVWGM